jgi:plastocyanin
VLLTILILAVVLFLFWGGPLWNAPPGASHVGRIVWSYAVVVPMVAVALLIERRFEWRHFASAVGVVWAVKLVVTSSLYAYLATGSVQQYSPVPVASEPTPTEGGRAPSLAGATGTSSIHGVVRDHGRPVAGAIVVARTGAQSLVRAERHALAISAMRYDRALYLVSVRDTVVIRNGDRVLHNVHGYSAGRSSWNVPVPPGDAERALPIAGAGVYRLACDEHPGEGATLVVIDRQAAVVTDAEGRFALHELPATETDVDLYSDSSPPRRARVTPGAAPAVVLDLEQLDQR